MGGSVLAGFDRSKWQSGVYPGGGGYSFAFAKATEGNGYKDPTYDRAIAEIRAAKLVPGAYHFARPDLGNSPEAEADWFLLVVGDPRGMLLGLDLEAGDGNLAGLRDRFCDRVEKRAGGPCWWYSYDHFVRLHALNTAGTKYPYWAAWPDSNGELPTYNFGRPAMQQYGLGAVPGLGGQVDVNRFFGSLSELQALAVGGGAGGKKRMDRDDWAAFYGALIVLVLRDPPLLDANQPDGEDYYWADHTLEVGPRHAVREFLNAMKAQAAVPVPLTPVPGPEGPAGPAGGFTEEQIAAIARKAVEDALANG